MTSRRSLRLLAACAAGAIVSCRPALALLRFHDGLDQVFLNLNGTVAYDSNIFSSSGSPGDTTLSTTASLDYKRRAGVIGVNLDAGLNSTRFLDQGDQSYWSPSFHGELTKARGVLTGSLTFGAKRDNRADPDVNTRTTAWNYDSALQLKYPVNDRYSITSESGVRWRDYTSDDAYADNHSFSEKVDVFYTYTSKLDLIFGYRFRIGNTTRNLDAIDHQLSFGASGAILPKLSGSVRVGYQRRDTSGSDNGTYDTLNTSLGLTWSYSRRLSITATAARDFSFTATNSSVDLTTSSLEAVFSATTNTSFQAGVGLSHSRYLGGSDAGRHDSSFTYSLSATRNLGHDLRVSLTYTWLENWSTFDTADFNRHSVSLSLNARL